MAKHIQYNYSVAQLTVRVLVSICLSLFVLNVLHSASHFVDFLLHSGLVIKASRDKITLSYRPEQTHKLHTLKTAAFFSNKTNQTLTLP